MPTRAVFGNGSGDRECGHSRARGVARTPGISLRHRPDRQIWSHNNHFHGCSVSAPRRSVRRPPSVMLCRPDDLGLGSAGSQFGRVDRHTALFHGL